MPPILNSLRLMVRSVSPSIVTLILCCCLLNGCARTPLQEQLISKNPETDLSKDSGSCLEQDMLKNRQATDSTSALSSDAITILSWNIYKEKRKNWDTDLLYFSKTADIIFLQEAFLTDELRQVLQKNNLYWNMNSGFRYRGRDTGVLNASPVRPAGSCGLRQNEPVIGLPKTILIQKYPIQDYADELLVANVHGINITLGTAAYQEQIDALRIIMEQHHGPIILAGDFNNWNKKRTEIMLKFAEDLSLNILYFRSGERTLFWGEPVDQIFYRDLLVLSQSVIQVPSSDHNPITAIFTLKKQSTFIQQTVMP